jgi:hypothetical protein
MNQNHFVSLFVSIFLHLILIIGITGSFSFQISSLSSINNLTPIVVYAMYETKKQLSELDYLYLINLISEKKNYLLSQ